ncbi:MAG: DUF4402 domain-containing protein [Sphingomonadaceae bacterium]
MIRKYHLGAAAMAMVAAFSMSSAAQAATATATAKAEIVKPLVFQNTSDLEFGKIVVAGAGTVAVAADGSATCSTDLTCYSATSAAGFEVTEGSIGKSVTITMPSAVDLIRTGATDDGFGNFNDEDKIELGSYVTDATSTTIYDTDGTTVLGTTYSVTLANDGAGNGAAEFAIGGTITLDGTEVEGAYEQVFNVSVEYS